MKASFTSRITCSVLAATLAALPCNEALAAPTATATTPATPTTTPPATGTPAKPATATPAPTSTAPTTAAPTTTAPTTTTPPAAGTTTTPAPVTGTPTETDPNRGVDGTGAVTAPGETPTDVSGETPTEGETPPVEPPPPVVVAEPTPPPVLVGPERPPEPTVANGKYKAKGTGLMIAGGSLLGLGIAGLLTSYFLTRCDDVDNSFACKNKQNSTFAVPATGAAALLGAVLLAVGFGYRVRYKKWQNWKPSNTPQNTALYPTLLRGGAGVGYTLKF